MSGAPRQRPVTAFVKRSHGRESGRVATKTQRAPKLTLAVLAAATHGLTDIIRDGCPDAVSWEAHAVDGQFVAPVLVEFPDGGCINFEPHVHNDPEALLLLSVLAREHPDVPSIRVSLPE